MYASEQGFLVGDEKARRLCSHESLAVSKDPVPLHLPLGKKLKRCGTVSPPYQALETSR
jgi:hypothetical protein